MKLGTRPAPEVLDLRPAKTVHLVQT